MIIPLGIRSNNPGNLQSGHLAWIGELPGSGEIRFDTLADGIRAFVKLCYHWQARGWNTPRLFIQHYAPPPDNPTETYLENVCRWSGFGADQELDFHHDPTLIDWARAVFRQELGPIPTSGITDGQIFAGIALANPE